VDLPVLLVFVVYHDVAVAVRLLQVVLLRIHL